MVHVIYFFACTGYISITCEVKRITLLTSKHNKDENTVVYDKTTRKAGFGSVIVYENDTYPVLDDITKYHYVAGSDATLLRLTQASMKRVETSSPVLALGLMKFLYHKLSNRMYQSNKKSFKFFK